MDVGWLLFCYVDMYFPSAFSKFACACRGFCYVIHFVEKHIVFLFNETKRTKNWFLLGAPCESEQGTGKGTGKTHGKSVVKLKWWLRVRLLPNVMNIFIFHMLFTVFSIAFVPQTMKTKSRLENQKYANVTPLNSRLTKYSNPPVDDCHQPPTPKAQCWT